MIRASWSFLAASLTLALQWVLTTPARAEVAPPCSDPNVICYSHYAKNEDRAFEIRLKPGEKFTVVIEDTVEAAFTYRMAGVKIDLPAVGTLAGAVPKAENRVALSDHFDPIFGAYLVNIDSKNDQDVTATKPDGTGPKALKSVALVVRVDSSTWDFEFAGAFVGTDLVNPIYELRKEGEPAKDIIRRDRDKEDQASLGIAGFINTYHRRLPYLAATFGLGIREDNKVSYFLGPTLRLSDKMAITVGAVWSPIKSLPSGAREGEAPPDANTLSNLGSKTDQGWFVGVSYTFIDNIRGAFQKPFKAPEKPK